MFSCQVYVVATGRRQSLTSYSWINHECVAGSLAIEAFWISIDFDIGIDYSHGVARDRRSNRVYAINAAWGCFAGVVQEVTRRAL